MNTKVAVWLLVSFLAAGCVTMSTKQGIGTAVGAAIGGTAGAQIKKHGNRIPAIAAGVAIGGFIGNRIGKYLDDRDRERVAQATTQTAESGRPQEIRSPTNGATIRTAAVEPTPQASDTANSDRVCRTVRQTIELRDGRQEQEDVTVCKGPNGWEAA